jgi:hypothetical protein
LSGWRSESRCGQQIARDAARRGALQRVRFRRGFHGLFAFAHQYLALFMRDLRNGQLRFARVCLFIVIGNLTANYPNLPWRLNPHTDRLALHQQNGHDDVVSDLNLLLILSRKH